MQLTRLELHKLVCDRPLSKVAPELGISGTALAAICKQYQVPYPGSGYWTRKSLGLAADLPALPEAPDETIEITPSTPKPRPKKTPEEIAARKTRRVAKPDRPAKAALSRALSIANDLYLALHKQGYRVHIAQAADDLHRIHIKEQEVERKGNGRSAVRPFAKRSASVRANIQQRMETIADPEHTDRQAAHLGDEWRPHLDFVGPANIRLLSHLGPRHAAAAACGRGMRL
nr:hypothetical protein [Mesorhizobium sp.]